MKTSTLLSMLLLTAAGLFAQDPKKAPQATPAAPSVETAPEDVAVIKTTPYKPSIERDPFATPRDDRPANALDLVDDIAVKGMITKDGKNFAVVSDSRGNVRWLLVGHRFRDGEIASITDKEVTFRQWEENTTNRSVFRIIKKTFKREEGKR